MAPTFLLLLLWLQGCVSGAPADSVYTKVQHLEGETLSVQCSYKGRKNRVEGKVWCKIRKKNCEPGFTRGWVKGPSYVLQDDAQAKVVNITMTALKPQDSGRYWCMRKTSGTLYPLMGILLEVSPALTTGRITPSTHLANVPRSGTAVTTGPAPTTSPDALLTTSITVFTPGLFTMDRPLPSTASGATRLTFKTVSGDTGTSASTTGSRRTRGPQTAVISPSNARPSWAGPNSVSTIAGHRSTRWPSTGMYHTSTSLLNNLDATRHRDSDPTVLVLGLTLLPVPVILVMLYGFWKKKHRRRQLDTPVLGGCRAHTTTPATFLLDPSRKAESPWLENVVWIPPQERCVHYCGVTGIALEIKVTSALSARSQGHPSGKADITHWGVTQPGLAGQPVRATEDGWEERGRARGVPGDSGEKGPLPASIRGQ
ncbi:PREDICTED: trem-like transcript 2 protein [Galeopterus variegatus]|uniref:Trem-like transcript 2 protein n=1 Tax=Galeopterus variegatus TaxID=482537 RepID=A0ABM0QTH1_GALVR|nr:PREDICTED: trem-like transcript 2 protein [Galeopterus variegatus]